MKNLEPYLESLYNLNVGAVGHGSERHKRDQLANCMLLTMAENGPGGKSDTPAEEWFAEKDEAYLDMHLIPRDPNLWKLDRFEDFVQARQ